MAQPYTRLEVELEFVQCLANPFYLTHLSQSKVLDDERFLKYLEYLEYFRKPEYTKLLTYPVYSLSALTLLKQPQFRADIMNPVLAQEMLQDMAVTLGLAPSTTTTTTTNNTQTQPAEAGDVEVQNGV
ncbi:suppressor of hpr1 [Rhizina undulata]